MVNIAIAGGSGGVGRTIVEVMKGNPRHRAIILSRKSLDRSEHFDTPVIQVDYSDVEGLTRILEENRIHTVISTFAIEGDSLSKSQLNLIRAAAASSETKRFAPSAYSIPYPQASVGVLPPLKHYFDAQDELRKTGLEWTTYLNGFFLDYFATPSLKSYIKRNVIALDIENKVAAIPGTGNDLITFTYTFDVAKFIVASLDLAEWPEESHIVGDQMTWKEFLKLAEKARGCKFSVHYDSLDKLKRFEITELPAHPAFYTRYPKERFQWFLSIFELWTATGVAHISREGSLNQKFPDIKPLTVEDMLTQVWKAV